MPSMPSLQLDRSLFNDTLYSRLRELWFRGTDDSDTAPSPETAKRWFGAGPQAEKEAFDAECKSIALPALQSISPEKLNLPPFQSYDDEIENAGVLAKPFLDEVKQAQREDARKGADTMLSMALLLDQMPRNIFRDPRELPIIYRHYDRLAFALIHGALGMAPSPMDHPSLGSRKYFLWFTLPLEHSEHLRSHELETQLQDRWRDEKLESRDEKAKFFYQMNVKSFEEHMEPIRRFGRYPHRNQCLGRESTKEEEEYLKTANTFGVKQGEKKKEKDEL